MPIYKEDTKSDPNNYRPISILPIGSKLIEKIVFSQFYGYLLIGNNLLANSQHQYIQHLRLFLYPPITGTKILIKD